MWKRLIVLSLLTQLSITSSDPVINENTRETRQLNPMDCCPCPASKEDPLEDQYTANSRTVSTLTDDVNCPCRSLSDSEAASSIFRPAFKAREPLTRPVQQKQDTNPLLKPEVGLASSVLETLQEITDQDYQEALARDTARNALKFTEPELPESQPSNIFNIILNPEKENSNDVVSEASQIQEASCILPHSYLNNNFEREHSPVKLLKHIFSAAPKFENNGILHRNRFDMDGSASNIKDFILQPLKSNILEDIKSRSNLLKLSLLTPNTGRTLKKLPINSFRDSISGDRSDDQNSENSHSVIKPSKNNLPSLINYFRKPVVNNVHSVLKDTELSPSNIHKSYLNNDIEDRIISRNQNFVLNADDQSQTSDKLSGLEDIVQNSKEINIETQKVLEMHTESTLLNNSKLSESKVENTECTATIIEPNILGSFEESNDPMSPKLVDTKSDVREYPNDIKEETAEHIYNDNILDRDIDTDPNSSILQTEKNANTVKNVIEEISDSDTESTPICIYNSKDLQPEPSIISSIISNFKNVDKKRTSFSEGQSEPEMTASIIPSKDQRYQKIMPSTPAESDVDNLKVKMLPNIKTDILNTLENFKIANEVIQEKLRSNVQDALQLIAMKTEPINKLQESERLINNITVIKSNKNMSIQDLQKMSDSLLSLSSKKVDTSTETNNNDGVKEEYENDEASSNMNNMVSTTNLSNNSVVSVSSVKSEDDKTNSNVKIQYIVNKKKSDGNLCDNDTIVQNSISSVKDNRDNEMIAQSSNSIFNGISNVHLNPVTMRLLHEDSVFQPKDNLKPADDVNFFLNNFKPITGDIFKTGTKDYNLYPSENDNSNSAFFTKQSRFNIDTREGITKGEIPKFNAYPSLSSYKTKVASPESLNMNSLLPTHKDDVLGFASQRRPILGILGNPNDANIFRTLERDNPKNVISPKFKVLSPKIFQDNFFPRSLSENFKHRTNNALDNFRDSLDIALQEPLTINKEKILEALTKTRDGLNEKWEALHSDFNRRLTSISPRRSPKESQSLLTPNTLYNLKNSAELRNKLNKNIATIPAQREPVNSKNSLLSKSPQNKESNKNKLILTPTLKETTSTSDTSNKADFLRALINQKIGPLYHQTNPDLKKKTKERNLTKTNPLTKTPLKKNINLRPLKENKITLSFSTPRPDPNTNLKPSLQTDFKTKNSLVKLPKISKTLVVKKPILKSRSDPIEPNVLASENVISTVLVPDTAVTNLSYEAEKSHEEDFNYNDGSSSNIAERKKGKNLILSKIKNAVARGHNKFNKNEKNLSASPIENVFDTTHSATKTIERPIASLDGDALKENLSYKCKMVCIKDILDATNT